MVESCLSSRKFIVLKVQLVIACIVFLMRLHGYTQVGNFFNWAQRNAIRILCSVFILKTSVSKLMGYLINYTYYY